MTRLQLALMNVSRFNSLDVAKRYAIKQTYKTNIILGDDGKYWVPSTNREEGILIAAGYEVAK